MNDLSLTGMSSWLHAHSEEEMEHAAKFANHLLDCDVVPQIGTISIPEVKVVQAVDAFKLALEHEKKISEMIRDLARLAHETGDYDSRPLLNWFLDEQIEEEATVSTIVDRLVLAGEDGAGVLRIDAELGAAEH